MVKHGNQLFVATDGSRFSVNGKEEVKLGRRHRLHRVLMCLVRQHASSPGIAVEHHHLQKEVWPETPLMRMCDLENRCRVAICTLRKAGLSNIIVTGRYGYRLHISTKVEIVQPEVVEYPRPRSFEHEPAFYC